MSGYHHQQQQPVTPYLPRKKHKLVVEIIHGKTLQVFVNSYTDSSPITHLLDNLSAGAGPHDFEKDFSKMGRLEGKFNFVISFSASQERSKKDLDGFIGWLQYLKDRRKAAIVPLNPRGLVGYLYPHETDKARIRCIYDSKSPLLGDEPQQSVYEEDDEGPEYDPAKVDEADEEIGRGKAGIRPLVDLMDGSTFKEYFGQQEQHGLGGRRLAGGFGRLSSGVVVDDIDPFADSSSKMNHIGGGGGAFVNGNGLSLKPAGGGMDDPFASGVVSRLPVKRKLDALSGRARPAKEQLVDQSAAADHYNSLVRNREDMADSWIYHMRRFNNWVKSVLIGMAKKDPTAKLGLRVLDLACGKGGDLGKWIKHPDKLQAGYYVGVDIAKKSLDDAVQRVKGSGMFRKLKVKFVEADLGRQSLTLDESLNVWDSHAGGWRKGTALADGDVFDVASIQFALHYMAESEERLRAFLMAVAGHLRIGGQFMATTVDANVLVQLLMGHSVAGLENMVNTRTGQVEPTEVIKVVVTDKQGHTLLSVLFDKDTKDRILSEKGYGVGSEADRNPWGIRYWFKLMEDENQQAAVDAPEWMLPLPMLKILADECGLELKGSWNFRKFYHEFSAKKHDLMAELHVLNLKGSLSEPEWRIAGLYTALIFEKKTAPPPTTFYSPHTLTLSPPSLPVVSGGGVGGTMQFQPTSPEGPPPADDYYFNSGSTEGQFQPTSPEGPPPPDDGAGGYYQPTSPEGPPPPDGGAGGYYQPTSPEGPPPADSGAGGYYQPTSPKGPPPPDDDGGYYGESGGDAGVPEGGYDHDPSSQQMMMQQGGEQYDYDNRVGADGGPLYAPCTPPHPPPGWSDPVPSPAAMDVEALYTPKSPGYAPPTELCEYYQQQQHQHQYEYEGEQQQEQQPEGGGGGGRGEEEEEEGGGGEGWAYEQHQQEQGTREPSSSSSLPMEQDYSASAWHDPTGACSPSGRPSSPPPTAIEQQADRQDSDDDDDDDDDDAYDTAVAIAKEKHQYRWSELDNSEKARLINVELHQLNR